MYCFRCGKPHNENDLYCVYCGQQLHSITGNNPESNYCINCGSIREPDSSFCNKCGKPFSKTEKVPSCLPISTDDSVRRNKNNLKLESKNSTFDRIPKIIIGLFIFCLFVGLIFISFSIPKDHYIKIGTSQYLLSQQAQKYLEIVDESDYEANRSIIIIDEPHSDLGQQFNLYKGLEVFFSDNPNLIDKTIFLAEGYPSQQQISVQPLIDIEPNADENTIKEVLGSYLINGYIAYLWKTNNGIRVIGIENNDLYNLSVTEYLKGVENPESKEQISNWEFTVVARNEKIAETTIKSSASYENPILFIGGLHLTPQDESSFLNSQQNIANQSSNLDAIKTTKNRGIRDYLEEQKIGYTFLVARSDINSTMEDQNEWDKRYTELFYAQRTGNYDEYINSILSEDYGLDYTPATLNGTTVRPATKEAAYFVKVVLEHSLTPARGLPPNTTTRFPEPNGNITDRTSGPDGKAIIDKDYGHSHNNCPDPHCHEWNWSHKDPREECIPCPPGI